MRGCGLSATVLPVLGRESTRLRVAPAPPPACVASTPLALPSKHTPEPHRIGPSHFAQRPLLQRRPVLLRTFQRRAPVAIFTAMASLPGMVASAAMSGQGIRVEVADDRRFQNTMLEAVPLDGPPAMALPADETFLEAGLALARKAVAGMEEEALNREGPFLYTGLLGAALLCLRSHEAAARVQVAAGRAPVVAGAGDLLEKAEALVGACERAASRGRVHFGFFTGQPGVHAVGAAVAAAQGKEEAAARHVQRLEALLRSPKLSLSPEQLRTLEAGAAVSDSAAGSDAVSDTVYELAVAPGGVPHEVLYGRTGLLWAALFANKACASAGMPGACLPLYLLHPIASTVVASGRALAAEDVRSGRRGISGRASTSAGQYPPLMWEWHGKRYWGAAHGLAGILHVLLLAHQAGVQLAWRGEGGGGAQQQGGQEQQKREEACVEDMKATLRYMCANRFPSGNFPTAEEGPQIDCRVHWCHGAPGTALTLALFAKSFPSDEAFAAAAEQAGELVWARGLLRRVGLCHGISGNAYSLLALSQIPGAHPGHKDRARAFGAFLLTKQDSLLQQGLLHGGDAPLSLMEGLGGPACLFMDLSSLEAGSARFPGYEI